MIWTSNAPWGTWLAFMAASLALFFILKRLTGHGDEIPVTRGNFGKEISLWRALALFFRQPTMFVFGLLVLGMWALRIGIGRWNWRDLAVGLGVVVLWPVIEWLVHVYILHAKPRTILGFKYDPLYAHTHRAHHRVPYDPRLGLSPPAVLAQYGLLIPGMLAVLFVWPRPVTLGAVITTLAFRYEVWHFLMHTPYKPTSAWFRRLRDRHWWHHFQHEGYWYGVTMIGGDILLGTNPEPQSVPKSPTARSLGHATDAEEGSHPAPAHTPAEF